MKMKKISFQHQNTKAKAKDYSKHYNKDVKIIYTDGTENNGQLINIMTNNHGKKTITIEKRHSDKRHNNKLKTKHEL